MPATAIKRPAIKAGKVDPLAKAESIIIRLCTGLIAHPKQFKLTKVYAGQSYAIYRPSCHAADCKRIIGVKGDRYRGLQFVAEAIGRRLCGPDYRLKLDRLEEPSVGNKDEPFSTFVFNPKWSQEPIKKLAEEVFDLLLREQPLVEIINLEDQAILCVLCPKAEAQENVHDVLEATRELFDGIGTTAGCKLTVDIGYLVG